MALAKESKEINGKKMKDEEKDKNEMKRNDMKRNDMKRNEMKRYEENRGETIMPSYLVIPVDREFQTRKNLNEILSKMGLEKLLEQHLRNIIGGQKILTSQMTQASYANSKEGYIVVQKMFLSNSEVRKFTENKLMAYNSQFCTAQQRIQERANIIENLKIMNRALVKKPKEATVYELLLSS